MKKLISILITFIILSGCRKPIDPLDFTTNPIDPASGVVLKMVEIDSVIKHTASITYYIVYFHVNQGNIPQNLGTPSIINIYKDEVYKFNRVYNISNNKYSFYEYGYPYNIKYGFEFVTNDEKVSDMQYPTLP